MTLFAENRNSIDITGILLALLVPEDTAFRSQKLKVGTVKGVFSALFYVRYENDRHIPDKTVTAPDLGHYLAIGAPLH